MGLRFPAELDAAFRRAVDSWTAERSTERLWQLDATLWTGRDEDRWLGWLAAPEREAARLGLYAELARTAVRDGVEDVVLLGMGGSSLGAEVLRRSLTSRPADAPRLHVLDSTHPEQIARTFAAIDPAATWVLVASKSGSTLEPNLLLAFFLDRFERELGGRAPRRFIAITDPGSALERVAHERGFLALVPGEPTIGGRFSAISPFGLVPAALLGFDLARFVKRAAAMAALCREGDVAANPGVELGLALAVAAENGRDKLLLAIAPEIAALGGWIEQLVAESTGKVGKMILPVDGGELKPGGADRLVMALRTGGALAPEREAEIAELAERGVPVVELACPSIDDLGAEFFRWEIATAVAGARLRLHPFDQPDVEAAKIAARRFTVAIEATGQLPGETPFFSEDGVELHADEANREALLAAVEERSLAALVAAHLDRAQAGDYVALLAFLDMDEANETAVAALRESCEVRTGSAVTVGFGPRFLHSTGQAHKGGPASGVFLQLTERPLNDLAVPGQRLTFGQVVQAQALGDLQVLAERGRRHLRIHFARGAAAGWEALERALLLPR
jgi:transaldolase/glucose-6-phosphate isomerase